MQMKFQLGFRAPLGLVLCGIFLGVRLARLDLVVVGPATGPRRRLFLFRHDVDHQPLSRACFQNIRLGRIGLAQLGVPY